MAINIDVYADETFATTLTLEVTGKRIGRLVVGSCPWGCHKAGDRMRWRMWMWMPVLASEIRHSIPLCPNCQRPLTREARGSFDYHCPRCM